VTFSIRLLPADKKALERAAKAADRPPTVQARKIITDWLREQERRT
jgi:predicted transcriptional regulator